MQWKRWCDRRKEKAHEHCKYTKSYVISYFSYSPIDKYFLYVEQSEICMIGGLVSMVDDKILSPEVL